MYPRCPIEIVPLRIVILAALVILVFTLFVVQSQLPDYFKNLHMFMIDNSHGNELSRAKNIKSEMRAAPKRSFTRLSLLGYYLYTYAQERRAPRTAAAVAEDLVDHADDQADKRYYRIVSGYAKRSFAVFCRRLALFCVQRQALAAGRIDDGGLCIKGTGCRRRCLGGTVSVYPDFAFH